MNSKVLQLDGIDKATIEELLFVPMLAGTYVYLLHLKSPAIAPEWGTVFAFVGTGGALGLSLVAAHTITEMELSQASRQTIMFYIVIVLGSAAVLGSASINYLAWSV
jgi:hypothetical protein